MGKTALITGASAGLGVDFARLCAADKYDLVLVARRKDRLDALGAELAAKHGIKAFSIAADLMDPAAPAAIADEVQRLGLAIDVLINNAGFGSVGKFVQLDATKEIGEVQCNVGAMVALTRSFLPGMVERRQGHVLNVGSTAGFQPGPFMATYFATKAFVNSFTEALAFELKGTGVTATVSCPGPTSTEFFGAPEAGGGSKFGLAKMAMMTSEDVAREAYRAMRAGKPRILHGLKNAFTAYSIPFMPRAMVLAIAASLNRSPEP